MKHEKILISIPHELAMRMRVSIEARQRSKLIANLIEKEVIKREKQLYDSACLVEQDQLLNQEMQDFDVTIADGLDNEAW
jgi:hypothetical protein